MQRTGWGKSLVYLLATRVRRDAGAGPTLLVSPLLALMRNQIAMAERLGVRAVTINSTNRDDWEDGRGGPRGRRVDVLLISPERLANERLRDARPAQHPGLDRPVRGRRGALHLRLGPRLPARLPAHRAAPAPAAAGVPVLATTATANDRVVADVADQLGRGRRRSCAARSAATRSRSTPSQLADQAERLGVARASSCPQLPGSGIVYCLTRRRRERVAAWLRVAGHRRRAPTTPASDDRRARGARGGAAGRTSSRRSSRRSRSAWASTSPTSASSSTSSAPARRSPTTSRSAAPGGRSSRPTASCWPGARTTRSPTTSSRRPSRRPSTCRRSSTRWPGRPR